MSGAPDSDTTKGRYDMTFCERLLEAIAATGGSMFQLLLILQAFFTGCL